ncbi:ATP-binding cassette domain-containing protein [Protaetiibacter mangrovi]|uniref:ATP-binding cassette domain-containing protein n=1 Tax=Protaetiibacter mangrovi TaxID=2970926 RepID=A0ABT1ZGT7_9MICO|nr:ATP-binding cassette domain-containing protein [Protaetiibacter mangrovi]MCS0499914.1 ATP-binding cassette domain-containing protein [Protaetiibacter mangrovi]TPW91386.1 ABC transporter ATP-binding protein [Schumannella luteola]
MTEPLLEANDLDVSYGRGRRARRVVSKASFAIAPAETLALVGESGSGKTTVARAVVGLVRYDGELVFGDDRVPLTPRRSRELRRQIPIVFQDPRSSLNPRMSIGGIIGEVWSTHPEIAPGGDRRTAIAELLGRVGLDEDVLDRRAAQLSGGQCQRVSIARALAQRPRLLVCDEAVSALDVSVQAQILQLLIELKTDLGISMLFITHDLGVVRQIADSVAVMQHGEIVEIGATEQVFTSPAHAYTRELLDAALDLVADHGTTTTGDEQE